MPTVHAQLTAPFTADRIATWGGASTPEAQAATVALFNAIGQGDAVLAQAALDQGAAPNAQRQPPTMGTHPMHYVSHPLDIALWLTVNDGNDRARPAPNAASLPPQDLASVLIRGGATTFNLPSVFFSRSDWESHPACQALEHHFLDLLVTGRRQAIMTREARETPASHTLFRSVVVATPVRNPHSWLHRAIVRERWDAVKTWVDQDLVLNFPGSESACELLAMGWMDEFNPEAERTLFQGFELLRPGLLRETDEAYRTEVVGTLRALAFFRCSTTFDERRARLKDWLGDLVRERPLTMSLSPEEAGGEDGPEMRRIMQGFEARALREAFPAREGPARASDSPERGPDGSSVRRRL